MSSFDPQKVDQLMRDGIDAAKSGKKEIARSKFREVVAVEQNNEKAWFWLASVSETDDEKIFCLGNVTVINPDNERAKQMLEALLSKTASGQQAQVKSMEDAASAATNRKIPRIALIVAIPVLLLLVIFIALPKSGSPPPAPTEDTTTTGTAQTQTPVANSTKVASNVTPTITLTEALVRPTLPPSWTPVPSPTSSVGIFATPLASPPPDLPGRLIAKSGIQRTTDENLPMFILSPDGSNMRPVQNPSGGEQPDRGDYGILTPDGGRIIFARYLEGTEAQQMVLMNTNGTQARELSFLWNNLPPLADHQMLQMSRNAKILVFVALNLPENDGNPGVYYVPLNFAETGELGPPAPTASPTATVAPTVRPTEKGTAAGPETPATPPTPVPVPTEGPTATFVPAKVSRVTAKGTGKNTWPTLSPDGKTVIYASDTSLVGRDGTDLYSIPLTGGTPKDLTNDGTAYTEAAPDWSPDGKLIVFQAMKEGDNFNSIFEMDTNGQNRKVLVQGDKKNDNIRPNWSPDGKYVAFTSNRTGKWDIFIVDVASGQVYQVTATAGTAYTVCTAWSPY